ncbi:hypothetical protein FGU64_03400 [Mesorhizobium sp. 8]|nr:hypothetical protein FGU64_03400 [Mesorhizobium sp. 8]
MSVTSSTPEQAVEAPTDPLEEIIAAHGGDLREALRVALEVNAGLEQELALAVAGVSFGYGRGWHHRRLMGLAKEDRGP